MKPPQRRRKVPARYVSDVTGPTAWSPREKRQLLRLLQARQGQPEPAAAELTPELPGRTEAEIRHFIQKLKGQVVREAIRKVHPGSTEGPRRREAQLPAPIEVWIDLAEKITGPLEDALTAAFSQVLTIAAAEPLSLLHSKPRKPTKACGKPLLFLNVQEGQKHPAPAEASGPTPEAADPASKVTGPTSHAPTEFLAAPSVEGDFAVDFEKIYKYLSSSFRSAHGPELSAAESAVVLDLLMSLPEELSHLPCKVLAEHMTETYARPDVPQLTPLKGRVPGLGLKTVRLAPRGQRSLGRPLLKPLSPEN